MEQCFCIFAIWEDYMLKLQVSKLTNGSHVQTFSVQLHTLHPVEEPIHLQPDRVLCSHMRRWYES